MPDRDLEGLSERSARVLRHLGLSTYRELAASGQLSMLGRFGKKTRDEILVALGRRLDAVPGLWERFQDQMTRRDSWFFSFAETVPWSARGMVKYPGKDVHIEVRKALRELGIDMGDAMPNEHLRVPL